MDSNRYFTGTNNPELYIMLCLFIVMFDEYSEQNTLSILSNRKNDSDSDTTTQMKTKASFQSKAAQHSFKS